MTRSNIVYTYRCLEGEALRLRVEMLAATTEAAAEATAAEAALRVQMRKEVGEVHATHATTHATHRLVVLAEVVPLPALWVRQYGVRFRDELELFLVATLVGMVLQTLPAVRFLDLDFRTFSRYTYK